MELGQLRNESLDIRNERDRYKKESHELSNKLDKECNDNYKLEGQLHDVTKQRDSLIKDVEKLREEKEDLKQEYELLKKAHSSSWAEKDNVIKKLSYKYRTLTEHIKDKANNNPSEHRYFRLVHFIDDLEAGTDD